MRKYKMIFFSIMVGFSAAGQSISISRIDMQKDKLIIFFKLEDANPNHLYQVSLYASKDNFASPLTKVIGDVGTEVKPGDNKKIEWDMVKELGSYNGDLELEIRAGVFVPFVKLTSFSNEEKYKRGKAYPLLWSSGNMGGQVDIDLIKDQTRVTGDRNVPNTGKYEYAIPGSVKPGMYQLKFTNTRNRDEYVYSEVFRIVPKVPFIAKAGAALLVGGGVYLLLNTAGGDNTTPPTESDLKRWPDIPGN